MTRLWPYKEVKRRVHFYGSFIQEHVNVFENYEAHGGDYHPEYCDDDDDGSTTDYADSQSDSRDDPFVWFLVCGLV